MEIIKELRNKLASMCLEYANMESKNNTEGRNLLFTIQEFTKALNAINGETVKCHKDTQWTIFKTYK